MAEETTGTPQAGNNEEEASSWAAAAQPSQPAQPAQPPAAAAAPDPAATLSAAQNPDRSAIETTANADGDSKQFQYVPMPLRPVNTGLRGVIDKIGDVLAGTTRPEIYEDEQGNKFVYHPELTHGQQWQRIAAEAIMGAGAGLANGQGRGGSQRALAAGISTGAGMAQHEKDEERQMNADARQAMLDKAQGQMLRMQLAEQQWRLSRLQPEADEASAKLAQAQGAKYAEQHGQMVGTMAHPWELSKILNTTPDLAAQMVQKGTINVVPHYQQGTDGNWRAAGIEVWKMPDGWRNEMLPAKSTFDWFNQQTGEIEQHTASDPMTAGEQSDYHTAAAAAQAKWKSDQAELKLKQAQTRKADADANESETLLPLKKNETQSVTAKNWAEAHKANMEAQQQQPEQEDVNGQAEALLDGRSAPSLQNKRSKSYNAIMHQADVLSMQRYGHAFDQTESEQRYKARTKLVQDFTDGDSASTIESFDKFLGHALSASEAVNNLRNSNIKLVNMPLNKLAKLTGSDRSPALQDFLVKHETLKREFETSLKNNAALTNDDRKAGDALLDDSQSPAVMQSAMQAMAHVATTRLRAKDFTYSRTTGHHVPDLLSPEGEKALQHFGIQPQEAYSQNVGRQQNPQQQDPNAMVTVKLANGTPGQVPRKNLAAFQQANPGSQVVQ